MLTKTYIIHSLQEYFKTQPVLKAYLFGSYARNEANEDSDVDVLVDLDFAQPIGLEFASMWLDLQDILGKKVDLVSEDSVSKYIKPYIENDKILVYERKTI